jgi:hypothetical protein
VNTRAGILRFFAYALLVAGVSGLTMIAAVRLAGAGAMAAGDVVIAVRLALLALCVGIFGWIGLRDRLRRPLALAFVALFGFDLVRELQDSLDRLVMDNFWRVSAALLIAVTGVYLYRHSQRLVAGWQRSWPSAGLAILLAGLMLFGVFAQILPLPAFWQASLGDDYSRNAVRGFQELASLGACLIVLVGSLEFLYAWSRLPHTREMDRPRRRRRGRGR